jgi:hypothetical protein
MIMTITKSLTLTAVAALSLGGCADMADGPGGTSPDYQSQRALALVHASMHVGSDAGQIVSRSSNSDTD